MKQIKWTSDKELNEESKRDDSFIAGFFFVYSCKTHSSMTVEIVSGRSGGCNFIGYSESLN